MVFGARSSSQLSLLTLLPSTWCAAVAAPHRNFDGKGLEATGVGLEIRTASAFRPNSRAPSVAPMENLALFCIHSLRFICRGVFSASLHFKVVGSRSNANHRCAAF